MSTTIAAQMINADLLKLRKRRGTLIWSLILTVGPLLVFFVVRAIQHSSEPLQHPVAGGVSGFEDALRVLAMIFAPLAAIMIGVEAGAGDVSAGVFRDLVVTGRSRTALFASRIPAALGITWLVSTFAYLLLVLGSLIFSSDAPDPSGRLLLEGFAFTLLSTGIISAVAVGFSSLTASRATALTVLIGWQLVASPILSGVTSLGEVRRVILSQAIFHFSPAHFGDGGQMVTMPLGVALIVIVVWLAALLALGCWRTRTMDA